MGDIVPIRAGKVRFLNLISDYSMLLDSIAFLKCNASGPNNCGFHADCEAQTDAGCKHPWDAQHISECLQLIEPGVTYAIGLSWKSSFCYACDRHFLITSGMGQFDAIQLCIGATATYSQARVESCSIPGIDCFYLKLHRYVDLLQVPHVDFDFSWGDFTLRITWDLASDVSRCLLGMQ